MRKEKKKYMLKEEHGLLQNGKTFNEKETSMQDMYSRENIWRLSPILFFNIFLFFPFLNFLFSSLSYLLPTPSISFPPLLSLHSLLFPSPLLMSLPLPSPYHTQKSELSPESAIKITSGGTWGTYVVPRIELVLSVCKSVCKTVCKVISLLTILSFWPLDFRYFGFIFA